MNLVLFLVLAAFPPGPAAQQEGDLSGEWHIVEFTMYRDGGWTTTSETRLEGDGSVWDLSLEPGGLATQTSNMRNGSLESFEGQWDVELDTLRLTLEVGGRRLPLAYTYEREADLLVLRRGAPEHDWGVVATFRRE